MQKIRENAQKDFFFSFFRQIWQLWNEAISGSDVVFTKKSSNSSSKIFVKSAAVLPDFDGKIQINGRFGVFTKFLVIWYSNTSGNTAHIIAISVGPEWKTEMQSGIHQNSKSSELDKTVKAIASEKFWKGLYTFGELYV